MGALAGGTFLASLLMSACSEDTTSLANPESLPVDRIQCSIPQDKIIAGGPGKDGIPALTNPSFVRIGDRQLGYLRRSDRVVGLILESGPIAIPLNILWWHEIVNLDGVGQGMAITHCPLTGSSMAFQRSAVSGAEFGVTGLLYKNNLIMYDRDESESFWPQMLRAARCGVRDGDRLPMIPTVEMTWEGWQALFPQSLVVSENTGFVRDYREYPYGDYDAPEDPFTLFPAIIDSRRPPKERVLGIPSESGGLAFPFGLLDERGPVASVSVELGEDDLVVFWNRFQQAAMAYRPVVNDERLTFATENGWIIDDQTGSRWRVDGLATSGPLASQRLQPIADAFVAYWFAWPEFYPEIRIWTELQSP